jgi:protein phosphatase
MKITLRQPYSYSQIGGRSNQEDARYPDMDKPSDYEAFFVVCDGVGGQDKGEVASRTVCEAFAQEMKPYDISADFSIADFQNVLTHVFERFHKAIKPETKEMATTLTFVCFNKNGVLAAHIGDSRIYQYRSGVGIMYKSEDHSLVNDLVRNGLLKAEDAKSHPQANVITRCVCYVASDGQASAATVALIKDVEANDYFIQCSDGVLDGIDENTLSEILDSSMKDDDKCKALASLSRESHDNNTLYLVPVDKVEYEEDEQKTDVVTTEIHPNYPSVEVGNTKIGRHGFFKNLFGRKKKV